MIVKIQIAILMILLQMLIGCGEYVDVCNDNASKSKRGGGDNNIPASFAPLVNKLIPSVVNISTNPSTNNSGSGFIIDKDGYVVTSANLIEDANEIFVKVNEDAIKAKLVGKDLNSNIAVLKIENKKYVPVNFSYSNSQIGEWVIAICSEQDVGKRVTAGIISGVTNNMDEIKYIRTDALVNSANFGGPLFNMHGDVIGIHTIINNSDRSGTSISSIYAKKVIKKLIESGTVE